jgi:hypothetical protein
MAGISFTRDDIFPMLEGLGILGTGGGGSPEWGRLIMENDLDRGRSWNVVGLDDIPDDWTVVCCGMMGSVKAIESIGFGNVLLRWEEDFPLKHVIAQMEQLIGKRVDAVIPFEAGGLNSPIILTTAARLGIAAVDADALGRSAPETHLTSWHGHGIQIPPMPLVDSFGNMVVVTRAVEPTYVDEVGRYVVTRGGYLGANAHHPMTGLQTRQTSIPGTFTRALALGRALMAARQGSSDPVAAVIRALDARHLITARITKLQEEEAMGFYFTTVELDGTDGFTGRSARLIIKNEAMVAFLDGKPAVIFPDPIYMLDLGTGRGFMSIELKEGMEIVVLGAAAHPRLRAAAQTEAGRKAFSPRRFGQADMTFKPMEDLLA